MMLKQQIQDELKQAMLSKDPLRTSVLRMLKSAITYYEIQKGGAGYEATDDDVLKVIQKEAKQRKDSIEQFKNAGRQELVDKETKELEILQKYLPTQISEEEIRTLVKEAIIQTGVKSIAEIGKVMGALMPKVKGKADGGIVSEIVKESLIS
ncbi:MAG: GatB/YqeY domain-containing protein [Candidatus Levybacteria bacterium]|nr:GatB/YqeY domain-containing protein [Candidatus Levybacteria bacterium]